MAEVIDAEVVYEEPRNTPATTGDGGGKPPATTTNNTPAAPRGGQLVPADKTAPVREAVTRPVTIPDVHGKDWVNVDKAGLKDWGKRGLSFAKSQLTPAKLVTRWVPGVGTALLIGDVLDAVRGQVPILHHQPEAGRTQFLPVARNGHVDSPHGDTANSVDSMDQHLVDQNQALFGFEPSSVCSYCEQECGGGCSTLAEGPHDFDDEAAVIPLQNWTDTLSSIYNQLSAYEGEMWADRLLVKYGNGGTAELPTLIERSEDVSEALKEAVRASENMGKEAFKAFRAAIRAGREEMQARVDDENSMWGWMGDAFTHRRGDNALSNLQEATAKVHEAEKLNDEAVAKLNAALDAWTTKPAEGSGDDTKANPVDIPTKTPHPAFKEPVGNDPLPDPGEPKPGDKLSPSPGTPPTPADKDDKDDDRSILDEIKDKIGDTGTQNPFGGSTPSMGDSGSPFGSSTPSSMGGGGSPFDTAGASPLSGAEDPFAKDEKPEPLDEGDDPFEEDEDPEALEDEESPFEDAEGDGEEGGTTEGEELPGEVEPEPEDGEAPVTDAGIPTEQAAVDPNSEEARTVTLPDGRQIVFPDAKTAEMVKQLMAADPSAPTSIYMAADSAGFNLPPMGQDIGQMVPPSTLREGDLIMGDAGNGVYIGNGEVLMEDQSIKPLGEVSSFNGEHQGLFRLDNPEGHGFEPSPAADAPAQQVSSDGSTSPLGGDTSTVAADSTSVEGTPGVPDESTVDAADTADTAVFGGETSETTGMDPNAAAF